MLDYTNNVRRFLIAVWAATLVIGVGIGGVLIWAIIRLVNHFAP